jgi:hypothetical protein
VQDVSGGDTGSRSRNLRCTFKIRSISDGIAKEPLIDTLLVVGMWDEVMAGMAAGDVDLSGGA